MRRRHTSLAAVLLLAAHTAWADNPLADGGAPLARHERRTSSVEFGRGAVEGLEGWGVLFGRNNWMDLRKEEEGSYLTYQELPLCDKSKTMRRAVHHHTFGTEHFDVLYYDPASSKQRMQAQKYKGRAVAYDAALERDSNHGSDLWQVFARFIQIRCLPTRFRFTYIGEQRYFEYREGISAWEELQPSSG